MQQELTVQNDNTIENEATELASFWLDRILLITTSAASFIRSTSMSFVNSSGSFMVLPIAFTGL